MTDRFVRRSGNRRLGRRLFGMFGHGLCAVCYFAALGVLLLYPEHASRTIGVAWLFILVGRAGGSLLQRHDDGVLMGELSRHRRPVFGHRRRLHEHDRQPRRLHRQRLHRLDPAVFPRRRQARHAGVLRHQPAGLDRELHRLRRRRRAAPSCLLGRLRCVEAGDAGSARRSRRDRSRMRNSPRRSRSIIAGP